MKINKSKSIKLLLVALAIIVLTSILNLTSVKAAFTPVSISGTTQSIPVTREVKNVTNPVENTFTYSIVADSSNPAAVTGLPSSFTITFDGTENVSTTTATKTGNLNLSNVRFSELGDYKFKITETASSNATLYPVDSSKTYYIHVSVRNNLDANNVPTGTLVATLAGKATEGTGTTKVDIKFASESEFTNITLSNSVSGNMARKDLYFKFKVDIEGVNEGAQNGETYKIIGEHSTDGTTTVSSSDYVVGTTEYIYLKHGQSVTIGKDGSNNQIPVGVKYQVVEQDATEYTTTINNTISGKDSGEKTTVEAESSNVLAFLNNYSEATLTGVFMNVLPYAILLILAMVGMYAINKTKKSK